ncbi:MAG TPA: trehalose-phosphatase, partial [Gemmatimonadaceae bacterium]|nr:trehalose-phosphatase [Gemmatimonadaceae bacterium]
REVLLQAARNPALDVAIVSGRALADVKQMVNVPGLTYVGDHGFTIEGPGLTFQHEALADTAAALDRASQALAALDVPGAWVERKAATLALHLRHVADADVRRVERDAERILRRLGLHTLRGKRIVEGRPPVEWHKGRAVLYLLARRHGADWASRVRALYIGDDVTDEDAFESLHGIGRSICVAAPAHTSTADLRLPDPDAVIQLLRWLAAGGFAASAG